MNVAATATLGAAAIVAAVAWLVIERRVNATTPHWVVAAVAPAALLGLATLFALAGEPANDVVLNVARAAAVLAAASGGGLVATAFLRVADRGTGDRDDQGDVIGDATASVSDPRTLRGGTSIGILERIGVALTLLAGWPEGLALVLGVKGLGRYPELRRPAAAERFIIGTLASVLWAVATVGVVAALR